MEKNEKLLFLNKELENTKNELNQINTTMDFLNSLSEVPEVYLGNFHNYNRTLTFFNEKILWLEAKIQEIEAE